jgi:muramidase (phage lysozyme)
MWTQLENPADVTQGAGAMGPTVGDPLIARMAPLRPDNPFGFIIPPNTGKLMKLAGDSSNPGAVVPVDSQEKQAYLEWLVGADRNYVAGAMSSEERAHRDELGESTAILGHFGFVSKQENRRIEDYALLQNPRIRAYLDAVSGAEHADYNTIYGGGTFDDFSKHPSIAITRWGRTSRAAGRYQLEPGTYGDASRVLGMSDFSPPTQDLMAVERLRYRNALGPILSGDVATAINRTRDEWPSLPGGAQRELNSSQFLLNYQKLLQSYAPQ